MFPILSSICFLSALVAREQGNSVLTPRPEAVLGGKRLLLSAWPRFEQKMLP